MTARNHASPLAAMSAAILAAILVGCTAPSSSPSASAASTAPSASAAPSASTEPSATSSEAASAEPTDNLPDFTCTPTIGLGGTTARATISDVRVGTHDGYDRIVFEFDAGIPAVTIEAAVPPFYQDASGLPIAVAGTAFLKITMTGASSASLEGVVMYDGPSSFEPDFPRLVHLIQGGDFEAISTWYVGLDGGACLRVFTLDNSRLVIDLEH